MPTILVAIDLSIYSDRALRRATILARESGSSIRLLHVLEEPLAADAFPRIARDVQGQLDRIANAIVEYDGIACDGEVLAGEVAEQIAIAAEKASACLVITGPYKRRHLLDLVSSPTAEALAKRSHAPVLIANTLPTRGYRRILVATELEPDSIRVIRSIADRPLGRSPELFAVHIREIGSTLRFGSAQAKEDYLRKELKSADRELWSFLEESQVIDQVRGQARLNRSTTGRELEDAALELGCDAIAISSSQKPFLERIVGGSVAEAVVREVDCDIAIFP